MCELCVSKMVRLVEKIKIAHGSLFWYTNRTCNGISSLSVSR